MKDSYDRELSLFIETLDLPDAVRAGLKRNYLEHHSEPEMIGTKSMVKMSSGDGRKAAIILWEDEHVTVIATDRRGNSHISTTNSPDIYYIAQKNYIDQGLKIEYAEEKGRKTGVRTWGEASKGFESALDVKQWRPKFIMYHATPKSNLGRILSEGLKPSLSPHQESPWAPRKPVIYLTNSINIAIDYAEQAQEMGKFIDLNWVILMVKYDEFPGEIHRDLLWGLPGTYYTNMTISPEHLTLVKTITLTRK